MLSYLLFLNTLVLCLAHSWVERLNVLRDGVLDMQAGGYIRGNSKARSPLQMSLTCSPSHRTWFQRCRDGLPTPSKWANTSYNQ